MSLTLFVIPSRKGYVLDVQWVRSLTYREEDVNKSTLNVELMIKTMEIAFLAIEVLVSLLDSVFKIRIFCKETLFVHNSMKIIDV